MLRKPQMQPTTDRSLRSCYREWNGEGNSLSIRALPGYFSQFWYISTSHNSVASTLTIHYRWTYQSVELGFNFENESFQGITTLWLGFKDDISPRSVFHLHCRQCQIVQVCSSSSWMTLVKVAMHLTHAFLIYLSHYLGDDEWCRMRFRA